MQKEFLTELGINEENAELIINEATKDLNSLKIKHAVENELSKKGVKNLGAAMRLFNIDEISFENDEMCGFDEKIDKFISENDFLFEENKKPIFSAPATSNNNRITSEEFSKMSYSKRLKLFNENPQMYKELSGNN